MNTRLTAAGLALATLPVLAAAAPSGAAAEPCKVVITSLQPHVDEGAIDFPVSYTTCELGTEVTIKIRDRDAGAEWTKFRTRGFAPGTYNWSASLDPQDGQLHRWVSYATLKKVNGDGTVLAQSAKVYFKSPSLPPNVP